MNNRRSPQKTFNPRRVLNKLLLSGFVVISFVLYAINKPFVSADSTSNVGNSPTDPQALTQTLVPTAPPAAADSGASPTQPPAPTQPPTDAPTTASAQQNFLPTPIPPTAVPPTAVPVQSSTGYKDGTYTGPQVDALYGLVQVQAVIQNGKLKSVQFLQFPQDRRTSARINSIAVPDLQQEAIQAQSANVDIISGATLTSEAFIMSLQSALANSHS
jgi:uncharacterized protein with FMN-binding domain